MTCQCEATKAAVVAAYQEGAKNAEQRMRGEIDRLNRKLIDIKESLYGQNLQVIGWHLNGAPEPMDAWFENNDWEPITNPAEISSQLVTDSSNREAL